MQFFVIAIVCVILFFIIRQAFTNWFLKHTFNQGNVMVFGRKGKGKDVLFAHVINIRKQKHYSNIPYLPEPKPKKKKKAVLPDKSARAVRAVGQNVTELITLSDVNAGANDYENLIDGDYKKFAPRFEEKCDLYISDCGIFLPSHMDTQLSKKYRSFPILYALSRHLYNNNVHCNAQSFERVWKKLREQADSFILCKGSKKIFGYLRVKFIYYEKQISASSELEPFKGSLFNKHSKALKQDFRAKNGVIKQFTVYVPIKSLKYDTRHFKKMLIEENSGKPPKIFVKPIGQDRNHS